MTQPSASRSPTLLLGSLTLLGGAALASALTRDARAEMGWGTSSVAYFIIEVHNDSGPPTRVGSVVATTSNSYTDANSNTWAANSVYWFWDTGPAWPTINNSGDDGFRLRIAADQGDIVEVEPGDEDAVYDNDPFTSFDDDVGISGGTKRFKIWRVRSGYSNTLLGFVKEVEPSYDLSWYGFQAAVDPSGYLRLAATDAHFWFEPTTSTFNEDDIGVWLHEPR